MRVSFNLELLVHDRRNESSIAIAAVYTCEDEPRLTETNREC
jgi:hypothetical protein